MTMSNEINIPDESDTESATLKNSGVINNAPESEDGKEHTLKVSRESSIEVLKSDKEDEVSAQLRYRMSRETSILSAQIKNEEVVFRMSLISGKTPVALLQEKCDKQGIVPQYNLLTVDDKMHPPLFQYRVTVRQLTSTGCGQSKQKAKQSAAKALIGKLIDANKSDTENLMVPDLTCNLKVPYDNVDSIQENPVGRLQEMCKARMWRNPTYIHHEEGLPHQRKFSIDCVLGSEHPVITSGSGKSNKLAKRQAANEMIRRLTEFPMKNKISLKMIDEDELALGSRDITSVRGFREVHSRSISKFHENLGVSQGETLYKLHHINLTESVDINCIEVLEEIGYDQQFIMTYVDVENVSKRGLYQCIIQLCLVPVAVCFGEGENRGLAREAAAMDALNYLKLMTCKRKSLLV